MSLKSLLVPNLVALMTSERRLTAARRKAEKARKAAGGAHLASYFHQLDDPYSHLAAQALNLLCARYQIELSPYIVPPPHDWAAPERERLKAYARIDCERLAGRAGLSFHHHGLQPADADLTAAQAVLGVCKDERFLDTAVALGEALWSGEPVGRVGPEDVTAGEAAVAQGEQRREALGHFMSAMIHYGGEWYWGLDRLHYLEQRLSALGLRKADAPEGFIFAPPQTPSGDASVAGASTAVLHYYLSFRSPYTYIAAQRAKALADKYGAELRLRFVLPMVMRGLPVPPMKSRYFTLDTAREARRLAVPFGRICDPVGRPVERGYSLLPWAMAQGRGYEFCLSFMRHVWSLGVDAGDDAGLKRIVTAAGLDWSQARPLVGNDDWRAEAERNRLELLELGHWGVPCFRVGDVVVWGQDRLWVIEDALRALTRTEAS